MQNKGRNGDVWAESQSFIIWAISEGKYERMSQLHPPPTPCTALCLLSHLPSASVFIEGPYPAIWDIHPSVSWSPQRTLVGPKETSRNSGNVALCGWYFSPPPFPSLPGTFSFLLLPPSRDFPDYVDSEEMDPLWVYAFAFTTNLHIWKLENSVRVTLTKLPLYILHPTLTA